MEIPEKFNFKSIIDGLFNGVLMLDSSRKIIYWNQAAEKITGFSADEVIGTNCWEHAISHLNMRGFSLCNGNDCLACRAMNGKLLVQEDVYFQHKEGFRIPVETNISPIINEKGEVTGVIEIFSDNLAKIEAFQKMEKLKKLVFIDSLTGVGNRRYTEIKINVKIQKISRYAWEKPFGLLFIDIDNFKSLNDTYGHETGDKALKMVAKCLMNNIREQDFIGRWGGEEFVVLISDVDKKELYSIAEKLRSLVEQSFIMVNDKVIRVTISIGATMARRDETQADLVNRADKLMYYSKQLNKNFVTIG